MEVLLTVIIVEHLTSTGKQRLDVFPYPRGSIADDTTPHLIFRIQARFFDLLKGLAKLRLILHLMPTEQTPPRHPLHQWELKPTGYFRGKSPLGTSHFSPYNPPMYYIL